MTETLRCKHCNKGFVTGGRVTCSDCSGTFHYKCVNMTKEDLSYLESEGRHWRCERCNQERRKSRVHEYKSFPPDQILANIMKEIGGIRHEMHHEYEGIMSSMSNYSNKVEEYASKVDNLTAKINDVTETVTELNDKKVKMKEYIKFLESKVSALDQNSKEADIEIQGIPLRTNEDLNQVMKKLGVAVGFPVNDEMISVCYRIQARRNSVSPAITVRFVRIAEKEMFLKKCRTAGSITTKDIGVGDGSPQKIYINHSLTSSNKKLLNYCKELKKDKGYKFLWIKNGRIFLRKSENCPTIHVRCKEDLQNL